MKNKAMKISISLCLVLVLLPAISVQAAENKTEYYAIFADGEKIGHSIQTRQVEKEKVTHITSMELAITRMGIPITIRQTETHVETLDGRPLSFESILDMGSLAQKSSGIVTPDGMMEVTSPGFGQTRKNIIPFPKDVLMFEGIRLLERKKGLTEGTSYTRCYNPPFPQRRYLGVNPQPIT